MGSILMGEESFKKMDEESAQTHHYEPAKTVTPDKNPNDGSRGVQKGVGWSVWLLVILIVLLLASSIANLVVSQRGYESSQKQLKAMEQLTQSIKETQRSIMNLARMLEQSPPEEEEPEDETGPVGDGSI
jgi:uncharacterized membrane protein